MDTETILDGLLQLGEDDWIALWMIAGDVEELLGIDDPNENLEITVGLVRALLKWGFRAGDSPVRNSAVHFRPWSNQDADFIVDFIRREWVRRGDLPTWGDCPWFAKLLISSSGRALSS
jgi:hypothetical protein